MLSKVIMGLAVLMFGCASFGQECLGDLVSKEVNCCNVGMVENALCQGSIGNSCEDLLTLRQCTLTCSIAQAAECPNLRVNDAKALFSSVDSLGLPEGALKGCDAAFSEWIHKMMANRQVN